MARRWVQQTPSVWEGIVAQSTIRFAAGAGVVAASLLIVGPYPAEAVADKHGSGSHSRHDELENRSNRPSSGQKRSGPDSVNRVLDLGDADRDSKSPVDPPQMNLGTGRSDLEDLATVDSIAPDGPATLRSAAVAEEPTSGPATLRSAAVAEEPTSGPATLRSAAVAEEPTSVNASGAVPRSGSDHIGAPTVSVRSPRVVVGNGPSPGLQAGDPEPVRENPVIPEIVPPAVPVAIEVTVPPVPPPLPPVERIQPPQLVVGELGTAKVDTTTDPLFGLTGLILIPMVGAALGYRQARAAQGLRESART
jgi:hypothetical protein